MRGEAKEAEDGSAGERATERRGRRHLGGRPQDENQRSHGREGDDLAGQRIAAQSGQGSRERGTAEQRRRGGIDGQGHQEIGGEARQCYRPVGVSGNQGRGRLFAAGGAE